MYLKAATLFALTGALACAGVPLGYTQGLVETPPVPGDQFRHCLAAYSQACFAYASRQGIALKSEPQETAEVVERAPLGDLLTLLDPFESKQHPGWLMTRAIRDNQMEEAWVRRSDVVLTWEFQRVVGCWPVASIDWNEEGAGEYGGGDFRLRFARSGRLIAHKGDQDELHKRYAVYYAGGIFFLWNPRNTEDRLGPTFTLDYPRRRVTASIPALKPHFRLFKDEALKGCAEIPKVDPAQPIMPAPKRR
ncbi:MAG TPA: hypothetical protein VK143_02100 [Burkholderiales bacterium]|nr:hypothetical protein [Burkholderiales bacterium]